MGELKGFLKVKRLNSVYRAVCERIKDYKEVCVLRDSGCSQEQASRCMDCGTPFCHWGCPVGNYIPEWNDSMFGGHWQRAAELLAATNSLPEITGRLCPAPCEFACVLGISDDPVTIRENELAIVEYVFRHGLIKANPPKRRTGERVAVIGSGPAGLACADRLNRFGHKVVVFEKYDKIGGVLRYGIPDFKLEKWVLDRRLSIFKKEGIEFEAGVEVGIDYKISKLKREFDAICLAGGSRIPRDLKIEGRDLKGIHLAMDYLIQANKLAAGEDIEIDKKIDAKDKRVVVIGGGDTGADCVGVANRQGASCVVQIELLAVPPERRTQDFPWPKYPSILKTSTSHEEGAERKWSILTKKFLGNNGRVKGLSCVEAESTKRADGTIAIKEIKGTEFDIEADLVILALGFVGPEKKGLLEKLKVVLDSRGNVQTDENFMTSSKGVFCAGDMRRGQSLVVWALYEGRRAAENINKFIR